MNNSRRPDNLLMVVAVCLLGSLPRAMLGTAIDGAETNQALRSGKGFSLTPVDGSAVVVIHHSSFPGKSWRLHIPEHAYIEPGSKRTIVPSRIVWERLPDGGLRYRWNAPSADKHRWRLDYWCRLKPGPDYIDFELTGRNAADKVWGDQPWEGCLRLVCFQAGGNPAFHDFEAQRTYVRLGDRWVTMHEVVKGRFESHRMAGLPVEKHGKPLADRLAARISKDGKWVVGIATNIAGNVSFNFQTRIACMHSNPYWPNLKPGETASARGRIYLLRGDLNTLWTRYRQDFYDKQGKETSLPRLGAARPATLVAATPSATAGTANSLLPSSDIAKDRVQRLLLGLPDQKGLIVGQYRLNRPHHADALKFYWNRRLVESKTGVRSYAFRKQFSLGDFVAIPPSDRPAAPATEILTLRKGQEFEVAARLLGQRGMAIDYTVVFPKGMKLTSVATKHWESADRYRRIVIEGREVLLISMEESKGSDEFVMSLVQGRPDPSLTFAPLESPGTRDRTKVGLGRFIVVTDSAIETVSARNPSGVWEMLEKLTPLGTTRQRFALPRDKPFMDRLGNTRLRLNPALQTGGGVYLLADYKDWPAEAENTAWLRCHALAYHEGAEMAKDAEITVGLTSQKVTLRESGGEVENVSLNGEDFLTRSAQWTPVVRGTPCRTLKRKGTVWHYEDQWKNPLSVKMTALGDRLHFHCVYWAIHPFDDYNDLRIVFHPAQKIKLVEYLGYEHSYSDQFRQKSPGKNELMVNLSRTPFAMARMDNGAYLGVLDTFQNNIYFYASPAGQPAAVSVAYWAWPRTKNTVYRWEFELLLGYEPYANAVLRAVYPFTKDNHSQETVKGPFTYRGNQFPELSEQYGLAAHYYPGGGEYHRAGLYFDAAQGFDTLYDTPWSTVKKGYRRSYRMWQNEFDAMRNAGLEAHFYVLLGRVSEDVASRFDSSLARDVRGNSMVVGNDGTLRNIWVNMNPDLPFGSSLLQQIDQVLDVFKPTGITLDRSDSNDDRQGDGYFDLGHFDGSASARLIDGKHRPGSSMTLQNKRWILEVRKLLDQHQAKWFGNIPESLLHFRVFDLYKCDSFLDPWDLFFFRALGNGKPFFYQEQPIKRNLSQKDDFVSRLVQAYGRAEPDEMKATGYRIHKENRPLSRLLYIIPTGGRNPRFWVFADGTTEMNYGRPWSREAYERYWDSKVYDNAGRQLPLLQKNELTPPGTLEAYATVAGDPRPKNLKHESGENLLVNGGMEFQQSTATGLQCAPDWRLVNMSPGNGEQARAVADVSEGRSAQYIRAFDHLKGVSQTVQRYQPNSVYVLSFRAKVLSGKMAVIWGISDENGNRTEKRLTVDAAQNGGQWQFYTLRGKNGNSSVGRALYFTCWQGPAEFLLDDVVLARSP